MSSRAFVLVAVGLALLALASNQFWSQSVDLANHYALVARIFDYGVNFPTPDRSLEEMQVYPRLAHIIAAEFGRPFGSPFVGLQLAAVASLIVAWTAIVLMLAALGRPFRNRAILITAALLVCNKATFHLHIFGSELVGNFFFSQLAAQSALLCVAATLMRLERANVSHWIRYLLLIAATLVIEYVHLLPALEALGVLGVLMLSEELNTWRRQDPIAQKAGSTLFTGFLFAAVAIAVVAHPTFRVMRSISENNGDLPLPVFSAVSSVVGLAAVTATSSVVLLLRWQASGESMRRGLLPLKYFGALGFSFGILCIAQWLVLHFLGQGSEYAVKKYAFALTTILAIQCTLHLVVWVASRRKITDAADTPASGRENWGMGLFIAVAFFCIVPRHSELSVAAIRKLEAQTRQIKQMNLAQLSGKPLLAIHALKDRPLLDYMLSTAILETPRNDMVLDTLTNKQPSGLQRTFAIVTARGSTNYDVPSCRLATRTQDLVAVNTACYLAARQSMGVCRDNFDLTEKGAVEPSMLTGFSTAEPSGTWTDSPIASFTCDISAAHPFAPTRVEISGHAFVSPGRTQRVTVSLSPSGSGQTVVFSQSGEVKTITLPIASIGPDRLSLYFSLPDSISPSEAGVSPDARRLGLQISTIRFR